jgi:hypothetical protein
MDEASAVGLGDHFSSSAQRRGMVRCTPSQSRRVVSKPTLAIKGNLVWYLREGVLREMAEALQILQVEIAQDTVDVSVYVKALASFDQTRTLLEAIGLSETADKRELRIDDESLRGVIVCALETQYQLERCRLEDAAADGVQLDPRGVPALGHVVAQLRDERARSKSPHRQFLRWPRRHRGS